ncbi:MAG: Copper binding protein plastocyanin/azurin family [Chloroflexota bacterium]|jgi:plastocyanin|nr:Copper binding protein plastocyanin/azurin family [Chloroflexota bacterium]
MHRRTRVSRLAAALTLAAAAALVAAPASAAGATRVSIRAASYDPSSVALSAVGGAVRWANVTSPSRVHDVVSSLPDYFGMPLAGSGAVFRFTFTAAGEFTYFCSIHDTMLGAVSVPLAGEAVTDADGTRFAIRVASAKWPKGSRYISALFVQSPSDAAPRYWRTTRSPSVEYVPTVAGEYRFVARVKDRETHRHSTDSAPLVLTFEG